MDKKKISIDLFGTLIEHSALWKSTLEAFMLSKGVSPERYLEAKEYVNKGSLYGVQVNIYDVLGRPSLKEEVQKLYLSREFSVLLPHVKEVLEYLSSKYSLILICNNNTINYRTISNTLERHQIDEYFSEYRFSEITKTPKPNLRMWTLTEIEAHVGNDYLTDGGCMSLQIPFYHICDKPYRDKTLFDTLYNFYPSIKYLTDVL